MQTPFCAIMRSWTLLAAFGGSYAPGITDGCLEGLKLMHTLENIQQPSLLAVQSHSFILEGLELMHTLDAKINNYQSLASSKGLKERQT